MKTYIPKQPKHVRERIEAKLDSRLVERLQKYCEYLESDRDYILTQVLEFIFRKDRGFAQWLAAQEAAASPADSGPVVRNGRPVGAGQNRGAEIVPPQIPSPALNRSQERV